MESLRAWVLVLAGTALFGAVVGALASEGANRRAFRVLFAAAFLYVCLLPLRSLSEKQADVASLLTAQPEQEASLSARADDAAVLAAQAMLETSIEETLARNGVARCVVSVCCAAFDDGVAPETITVRGHFSPEKVRALLQPFLTAQTQLYLLTEEKDGG